MKLFWGRGTCAIGIHVLLEEAGLAYDTEQLDVGTGETRSERFLAINPKGKVPTLVRDDGSVLTEFSAIATWIARQAPDRALLPSDPETEARVVEMMSYVEDTIHGQGFARIFAPDLFQARCAEGASHDADAEDVREQGRDIVNRGFALLDPQLAGRPFAVGDGVTIADAALFYVERWAPKQNIEPPPNIARHFERMVSRPTVEHVRRLWGEA